MTIKAIEEINKRQKIVEIWFAENRIGYKSYILISYFRCHDHEGLSLMGYIHDRIDFDTHEFVEIKTIGSLSLESTRKFCKKQYGSKVFQRIS